MTLQNRVLPTGDIIAQPWRGTLMGNRGILHDDRQRLTKRRWQHPHWVTCRLRWKDWHRAVMQPRAYTELFFLDEPTALAAGHRPCGLCRHQDYTRFKHLFCQANGTATLAELDRLMQAHRVTRTRRQVRYQAQINDLPDGTFILWQDRPYLIWKRRFILFETGVYTEILNLPDGPATVLTPAATVATLRRGYRPALHPSARALLG